MSETLECYKMKLGLKIYLNGLALFFNQCLYISSLSLQYLEPLVILKANLNEPRPNSVLLHSHVMELNYV